MFHVNAVSINLKVGLFNRINSVYYSWPFVTASCIVHSEFCLILSKFYPTCYAKALGLSVPSHKLKISVWCSCKPAWGFL